MSEWLTPESNIGSIHTNIIDARPRREPVRRIINSDIVSASISKNRIKNLAEPVVFLMEHRQVGVLAIRCFVVVFWLLLHLLDPAPPIQLHSHTQTQMYTQTGKHLQTSVHIHTHTCKQTHTHTHTHMQIHTHTQHSCCGRMDLSDDFSQFLYNSASTSLIAVQPMYVHTV